MAIQRGAEVKVTVSVSPIFLSIVWPPYDMLTPKEGAFNGTV